VRRVASSSVNRRSVRRVFAGLLSGSLLALVPALDVGAHVSVSSPDAASGGFGKVVFRVPNESDSANTTAITVTLPSDPPFTFVSVGAVPGWTATTTTVTFPQPVDVEGFPVTEAVSTVTWTADDDGLPPEQFAEFQLSVGPFAQDLDEFVFPAAQTYSDGEVVNWADPTVDGQEEPQHPAPVLDLADTGSGEQSSDGGSDNVARALAIVGVALGAGGLALGWSARQSRRGEVQ
jgi:periplasmic copper chaperone A